MLREDRRAHIEKQLQSKTPIYESERVARFFTKQVVTGWNETYVYELPGWKADGRDGQGPEPWTTTLIARYSSNGAGFHRRVVTRAGRGTMIRKALKPARPATSPISSVPAATSPA